jgi:hypothetical protein
MVRLTDDAASYFHRIQAGRPNAETLRVVSEAGELVVAGSAAAVGDEIILHLGLPVLSLSPEAAEMLEGYTIGVEQTGTGPALQVIPPEDNSKAV